LRHAQLTAAGAPTIESPIAAQMPLLIGTRIHEWLGAALEAEGIPVMREVKLAQWLPEGWSGTADFLFYDPSKEAWVLADLKTSKGESYKFIRDGGAKDEHLWQVSAYWHALVEMGLPMVNGFGVVYLPKNDTTDKNEQVTVVVAECTPLPREQVWEQMEARWAATKAYLESLLDPEEIDAAEEDYDGMVYVTSKLAPVQERVQKMWWQAKTETWDVKLVPHWSADYCPFPNELCDCSEQGTTKIGHFRPFFDEEWEQWGFKYEPRKGYEEYVPEVSPTPKEVKKRVGKHNPKSVEGASEGADGVS
jgi:hypothetical protein